MNRYTWQLGLCIATLTLCAGSVFAAASQDPSLDRARAFVEQSDRYLHHSKLRRGMKGYGLSVFAGTKIAKFDVEIISVVKNFSPRRDVVLAMLAGQGLAGTRVIQGMSGSPVYMKDPADGKFKMIGAVAYGWGLSKKPLCGIQPITQMLAISGALEQFDPKHKPASGKKTQARQARSNPQARLDTADFLRVVLAPAKGDFAELFKPSQTAEASAETGQLQPLGIPLLMSGCSSQLISQLSKRGKGLFGDGRLQPMQGGGLGQADKAALSRVELSPGSSIAVPLVTGDVGWVAFGTVTDVVGKGVLAFGHSFNSDGAVNLPISTGYVHTIVSTLVNSFKLGSAIRQVGKLGRDETVGIAGTVGPDVRMIPMSVSMNQLGDKRQLTYSYKMVDEWSYTSRLAGALVQASASALRNTPRHHHVAYEVNIDFGKLGKYVVRNIETGMSQGWMGSSSQGLVAAASDLVRPIAALMQNPFGPGPEIKKVEVKLTVSLGDIAAEIIDFKLDERMYRPGEVVRGKVLLKRFRKDRLTLPVSFKLPDNLPDGTYTLTAGDWLYAAKLYQQAQPQIFKPKTVAQLFQALQETVKFQADTLYLHLPIKRGGIALGPNQLPDLPPSKAQVIISANLPDTTTFKKTIVQSKKTNYVIRNNKTATLTVKKQTNEMLLK